MHLQRQMSGTLLIAFLFAVPTSAQALEGTLKAIKERKAMVIGYLKDAYPMSFEGPNGPDGYSVELCRRVADEAGKATGIEKLEVRYVPVTLENRFDAVASGKVDIECGTTTATLSRMQKVDFTNLIFADAGSLAVKKGSPIRNLAALVDESVAVVPGTTTEKALRGAISQSYIRAKVVDVADHAAGIAAVQTGKVSAYASDRIILAGLLRSPPAQGSIWSPCNSPSSPTASWSDEATPISAWWRTGRCRACIARTTSGTSSSAGSGRWGSPGICC